MNIYLVRQVLNNGYDTYDSMVVAAPSEEIARKIHPSPFVTHYSNGKWMGTYSGGPNIGKEYEQISSGWVSFNNIDKLSVTCVGATDKPTGVILASFNAG